MDGPMRARDEPAAVAPPQASPVMKHGGGGAATPPPPPPPPARDHQHHQHQHQHQHQTRPSVQLARPFSSPPFERRRPLTWSPQLTC